MTSRRRQIAPFEQRRLSVLQHSSQGVSRLRRSGLLRNAVGFRNSGFLHFDNGQLFSCRGRFLGQHSLFHRLSLAEPHARKQPQF